MNRPWWHLSREAAAQDAQHTDDESFDGDDGEAPEHWDARVWRAAK